MEHYRRNADKIKAKARDRYREKKRKEFYNEINEDDKKEEGQSEWEKKLESIESK